MRVITIFAVLLFGLSPAVSAQDWIEYQNPEEGFEINFPGQPKLAKTTWMSEQGFFLPARVYSAETGGERYSVTVVDYTVIERLGMEHARECPDLAAEVCSGFAVGLFRNQVGPSGSIFALRYALVNAAFKFMQRDAKVTDYQAQILDIVEGYELHLTNNADQSRTVAHVSMHENKLYVLEGTVPKGSPEPSQFIQSLRYLDKNGNAVRYLTIYSNQFHGLRIYPVPPLVRLPPSLDRGGNSLR